MRRAVPKLLQPARWVPGLALRMAAAVATQVTAWFAALVMAIVVANSLAFAVMAMFASSARAATEFLDPEVAFKVSGKALDDRRIELRFDVASGYHLYRDRFSAAAEPASVSLEALQMPAGEMEFDAAQQKKVAVFRQPVTLLLPLSAVPTAKFWLQVVNQGCADQGLCYPPQTHSFDITPAGAPGAALLVRAVADEASASQPTSLATRGAVGAGVSLAAPSSAADTSAATSTATVANAQRAEEEIDDASRFDRALRSRNLWAVAGVFLLAGLLLSFTPCVLPMLPILSSIIVGQAGADSRSRSASSSGSSSARGDPPQRARGFSLALAYSLGMALVYTALGMAAGLAGEGLAAALQNAWVLGAFALLLVGLSLSMFGVYDLQMPSGLQTRLAEVSGRLHGGRYAGVFLMGGLSALIVGPCVAAPLAGALVYISRSRDVALGGLALFSLAAGMSVPLLLMGLSAESLLPRAGRWMERVKHFFGMLLLATALWMVSPVLPAWALMVALALLLLASAAYLGAFDALKHHSPGSTLTKGLGIALAAIALMQLVGVASGGRDALQPLAHFAAGTSPSTSPSTSARLSANQSTSTSREAGTAFARPAQAFEPITNIATLDAAVGQSSRPVLLDFYADWCVSCKEMESLTFTDAQVRQRMAEFKLLRIDVTANTEEHKALMRRHGLFGPPALLFFAPAGAEWASARVIGYQNAETFAAHLLRVARL